MGSEAYVGIDLLRYTVSMLSVCNETFNQKFSAEELIQIARMVRVQEWDVYPDRWAPRQIREALKGIPPRFNDDMTPLYTIIRRKAPKRKALGKTFKKKYAVKKKKGT